MPETSIVIRTFNEEKRLENLLNSIEKQNYKDYEIIIVDSGSTDKTVDIAKKFNTKVLQIESRDFTFGYSLNVGCKEAVGKYLVFASAHVLPLDNNWLTQMVEALREDKVAMVYGRQVGNHESKFSEYQDFKRIFKNQSYNSSLPINYANNANAAIKRELWEKRNFDEYLFGLEDIDWARSMTKDGYLIRYEPKAVVQHIHNEKWHQVFNRYRREAIAAVRIGLERPPQVRLEMLWLFVRLIDDLTRSFPNWSKSRIEEILRFRYYQFKGSRQGWFKDRDLDLNREKFNLFYPLKNEAVVIYDKQKARLQEISIPEMKPGDVLLKVDYVGICKTDLEVYEGTLGYFKKGMATYPIVPGHEYSGTITRIGSNNKFRERFHIGQKVVGECILSRGERSERREVGVINYNGAYSRYIVVPGDAIHDFPPGLDSDTAVLAEPLAVVLRAIRRIKHRLNNESKIAVMGAGPIGNFSAQVLSQEGYNVEVFDKNSTRLNYLKDIVKNTNSTLEGLDKFDVIIEATGSKDVLESVIKQSRTDCTILLLGFPYGDMQYNFEDLVGQEKVFAGSVGGDSVDFQNALKLLPKLDTSPFKQNIIPLEDFEKAWELLRSSNYFKIILKP